MSQWKYFLLCGLIAGFALYGIVFFNKEQFISTLNNYNLLPQPEPFTELYLEDHLNLPQKFATEEANFKFTVHNLEYKPFAYEYEVEAIATDSSRLINEGSFNLNHDEYKTITSKIASSEATTRTKINVSLKNKNQSIHFWVNNEIN